MNKYTVVRVCLQYLPTVKMSCLWVVEATYCRVHMSQTSPTDSEPMLCTLQDESMLFCMKSLFCNGIPSARWFLWPNYWVKAETGGEEFSQTFWACWERGQVFPTLIHWEENASWIFFFNDVKSDWLCILTMPSFSLCDHQLANFNLWVMQGALPSLSAGFFCPQWCQHIAKL